MALVIVMRCDVPGCEGHQTADFDALTETFVALLNSFRAAGWTLEMDGAKVVRAECNLFGNHRRLLLCPTCGGAGWVHGDDVTASKQDKCPDCNGSGRRATSNLET